MAHLNYKKTPLRYLKAHSYDVKQMNPQQVWLDFNDAHLFIRYGCKNYENSLRGKYGLDCEDQLTALLSEEIAAEIDREIMNRLLNLSGNPPLEIDNKPIEVEEILTEEQERQLNSLLDFKRVKINLNNS